MAGNIELKSCSVLNLETSGAILTSCNCDYGQITDLDNSASLSFWWNFELIATCGYSAAPAVNVLVDLYTIPAFAGGTNFAAIDTGTPNFPPNHYRGSFQTVVSSSGKNARFMIENVPLAARVYRPYIINHLGVNLACGWKLNAYPDLEQYT